MDSFIPKGGIVDRLRTTRPNKSPRVTRDDGSHGNKGGQGSDDENEPQDKIDIDLNHLDEKTENVDEVNGERPKKSIISLKIIRNAMIAQATKTQSPPDADPDYHKALSAYGSYSSITAPPPELEKIDEQGQKTKFGKINDLIDHGMDQINIERGQPYDEVILALWDQTFETK